MIQHAVNTRGLCDIKAMLLPVIEFSLGDEPDIRQIPPSNGKGDRKEAPEQWALPNAPHQLVREPMKSPCELPSLIPGS